MHPDPRRGDKLAQPVRKQGARRADSTLKHTAGWPRFFSTLPLDAMACVMAWGAVAEFEGSNGGSTMKKKQ